MRIGKIGNLWGLFFISSVIIVLLLLYITSQIHSDQGRYFSPIIISIEKTQANKVTYKLNGKPTSYKELTSFLLSEGTSRSNSGSLENIRREKPVILEMESEIKFKDIVGLIEICEGNLIYGIYLKDRDKIMPLRFLSYALYPYHGFNVPGPEEILLRISPKNNNGSEELSITRTRFYRYGDIRGDLEAIRKTNERGDIEITLDLDSREKELVKLYDIMKTSAQDRKIFVKVDANVDVSNLIEILYALYKLNLDYEILSLN